MQGEAHRHLARRAEQRAPGPRAGPATPRPGEGPAGGHRAVPARRAAHLPRLPPNPPPPAPAEPAPALAPTAVQSRRTCQQRRGGRHLGAAARRSSLPLPGEEASRPPQRRPRRAGRRRRQRHVTRGRPFPPAGARAVPEALPAVRAGWRREAAPPRGRCACVSGGRRRAVLTLAAGGARSRASGAAAAGAGRAGRRSVGPPWWPSSASAWPTRSTARTSRSAGTSPRPRGRPRRRRRRSGPGCWRCSSSWFADQPSSRSSRASGWACEGAPGRPPALPWAVPPGQRPASPGSSQQLPRSGAWPRPRHIPGPFTSHSEFSSPCHSALNSTTCIKQ